MPTIAELLYASYSGIELTIDELSRYFDIKEESSLDKLLLCDDKLKELGLSIDPSLEKGTIKQKRLVYIKNSNPNYYLKRDLEKEEGKSLEFKSTFLFDIQQSKNRPNTPISKLDSKRIVHSVLKTICAFLNSGGGILYVGITDDKKIYGLEKDFEYLGIGDFDKWELHLRNLIKGRFYDGPEINKYCIIDGIEIENTLVAKVEVKNRVKETFYKQEGDSNFSFYIRNGNRTDSVPIERLPEFIEPK